MARQRRDAAHIACPADVGALLSGGTQNGAQKGLYRPSRTVKFSGHATQHPKPLHSSMAGLSGAAPR